MLKSSKVFSQMAVALLAALFIIALLAAPVAAWHQFDVKRESSFSGGSLFDRDREPFVLEFSDRGSEPFELDFSDRKSPDWVTGGTGSDKWWDLSSEFGSGSSGSSWGW